MRWGSSCWWRFKTSPPAGPRDELVHAFSSHDRVRPVFGDLVQDVALEEGIRRMAVWAKEVGAIEGEKFDRIEVGKNMPNFWRSAVRRRSSSV